MKKIISIILTILLLAAPFTMNISAEEAITKTEALIKQIEETQTVNIKVSDSVVANDFVKITDFNIMFKIKDTDNVLSDFKFAATAKIAGLKARAIFGEENLVYAPGLRCYVDLNEFMEIETFDFKLIATGLDVLLSYLSSKTFEALPLTSAEMRNVKGYGEVYVERFGGVSEFYYDGDLLVGFRFLDLDNDNSIITVDIKNILPEFIEGISSGVDSSLFEKPTGFYINLTPLMKFLYDISMSLR